MLNMQNVKDIEIQEGDVRTIHDKDNRLIWGRLAYDTKYAGDTVQDGTPTPDAPIPVQVVTGEQTVTISDGVDSEDFTISLGSIELCKIGTYQDYIYQSEGDWYVHKDIGKSGLYSDIVSFFSLTTQTGYSDLRMSKTSISMITGWVGGLMLTTHFSPKPAGVTIQPGQFNMAVSSSNVSFALPTTVTTLQQGKDYMDSLTNSYIYYVLATSTDTQITDTTLISQLDAIHEWMTRYGYNATVTGNLPIIINQTNLT